MGGMKRSPLPIMVSLLIPALVAVGDTPPIDFARQIQPILAEKCILCHGPDERTREADLRLDLRNAAIADRGDATAILPGNPNASELVRRIESHDPDVQMPPTDADNALTGEERKLLRRWIKEGAHYKKHWAFIAPQRPDVPQGLNPIDYFVAQRLQTEGLNPSPLAERPELLRRLTLDLTGLPPSVDEIDAFLADSSADAYHKQVERLLASEHYGERWARWWMDAARYADSDGYEKDLPREQWPWRDWVISAFNRDLPYDQFITEQLAGDLLPAATQDQQVATGFLRNGMVNEEGAILAEEFRVEGLIDRMDCLGKAVLGLTLACTQCHDHKYDPLTQTEYYQILAYLNNDYEAISHVYSPTDQQAIDTIHANIAAQKAKLIQAIPDWNEKFAHWVRQQRTVLADSQWTPLVPSSAEVPDGICHPDILADQTILNLGFRPTSTVLTVLAATPQRKITGFRLSALRHGDLIFSGPGRNYRGGFALSDLKIEAAPQNDPTAFQEIKIAKATADVPSKTKLIDSFFRHNKEDRRLVGGPAFLIDGDRKTAWSPDRSPRWQNQASEAVLEFAEPIQHAGGTQFRIKLHFRHGGNDAHGRKNNFIGRFGLDVSSDVKPSAAKLTAEIRHALNVPEALRSEAEKEILFWAWAQHEEQARQYAKAVNKQWDRWPEGDSILNLALRQPEHQRTTRLLERGNWQQPAAPVQAAVPAVLHDLSSEALPANRLTLARWLVDRKSPTTARVLVNRIWQSYFGSGLVATSEDFGVRAAHPSHPDLLDWLAVELMEPSMKTFADAPPLPWSIKHLQRIIVASGTYRQTSVAPHDAWDKDPQNILLARGPRFRADAEMVRDIALSASGLLDKTVGGASVYPPVPAGLFSLSFTAVDFWNTAKGPERYRRSLYMFRRRSIPDPVLASFDAPSGDSSCVRRTRSNTPLAALTGLNAAIFTEAAQALALRILARPGATDQQRAHYGYRLCCSKSPNQAELTSLLALLNQTRGRLNKGELDAAKVAFNEFTRPDDLPPDAAPLEVAAWTIVARVLLNLDATLTKG